MSNHTITCPYCLHRQTKETNYSMIRCNKCGKLFSPNRTKKMKQEPLEGWFTPGKE